MNTYIKTNESPKIKTETIPNIISKIYSLVHGIIIPIYQYIRLQSNSKK